MRALSAEQLRGLRDVAVYRGGLELDDALRLVAEVERQRGELVELSGSVTVWRRRARLADVPATEATAPPAPPRPMTPDRRPVG